MVYTSTLDSITRSPARLPQVPLLCFQWQTAVFVASLTLNVINLILGHQSRSCPSHGLRFYGNLLLLYINGVALATELLIETNMTRLAKSPSGRL